MNQILYLKTHNITGKKYLGQTTRNPFKYRGSGVHWCRHIDKHGNDVTTTILFESTNAELFETVAQQYSKDLDVVNNAEFLNLIEEHGGSLGGKANPNYKQGKFVGRTDNPDLYKALDAQKHKETWNEGRKQACPRMRFFYYKRNKNEEAARAAWNEWYRTAKFKSKNRQALWRTDTFEMWYNRQSNELDFRAKYIIKA